MSLRLSWKCPNGPATVSIFFSLLFLAPGGSIAMGLQHPDTTLKKHHEKIVALSSDQEALEFNQSFIPKLVQIQQAPTRRIPSRNQSTSNAIPQEIQDRITTFWAAMATIANVRHLSNMLENPLDTETFSKNFHNKEKNEWISSKPSLEKYKDLLDFLKQLTKALKKESSSLPPQNDYAQFSTFHDTAPSTENNLTWIQLFKEKGVDGIEAKLLTYWQPQNQLAQHLPSDSQKQSYVQQYLTFKLLPLFQSNLLTQAQDVEAQAYNVVWESWYDIQQWHLNEQDQNARRRLCGKWKWIIHNHQNHGDHKTTMTFDAPGVVAHSQPQPSTILIHGETVYLKWKFPQGIQEDSLLLSNRDTRLEGTFTNSLGPHGSISGQRLSPCKK